MDTIGLYVHIPFCAAKCSYCDFLSFAVSDPDGNARWNAYKDALLRELSCQRAVLSRAYIDTVYIGGGTPTVWPAPFLLELLHELGLFNLTDDAEVTVEANPGTLSPELLSLLKESGVNRLSLGLQAWQDSLLAAVGRIHTQDDFVKNFFTARRVGYDNISVDVIFALPGQTLEDWRETIEQLTMLNPEHISAYSFMPEEGTPIWREAESGALQWTDDETDRVMYACCNQMLHERGYEHYELSNYAKKGFRSRHNTRYWTRKPYIGLGLGAHSFYGGKRWHNAESMEKYITAYGDPEKLMEAVEAVTTVDAMSETMFLGLRMRSGVSEAAFFNEFGVSIKQVYGEPVERLTRDGLITDSGGFIRLTTRGMDLANRVFMAFV